MFLFAFKTYILNFHRDLKCEKNKNSIWDQKLESQIEVFFKQNRNARLNEIFSKEIQKKNLEIFSKFIAVMKNYESKEEKQINRKLAKENLKHN